MASCFPILLHFDVIQHLKRVPLKERASCAVVISIDELQHKKKTRRVIFATGNCFRTTDTLGVVVESCAHRTHNAHLNENCFTR